MSTDATGGSIAHRVAQSLASFEAIEAFQTQPHSDDSQVIFAGTISDKLSRFKLWAGNIGAHRTGRSSLDYRLRDSSHLHGQVARLLDDLISSLNEVHSILSGETLPWDKDAGEVDEIDEELRDLLVDEGFEFDSELAQLTKEINDTINNLLRLSISLRNPAPHDRFMSSEYAKVGYFEANDKAHVEAKFPKASQTSILRLGRALSQRRQYFRYREAHHGKLAYGLYDSGRSEAGAQSTVASSIALAMKDPKTGLTTGHIDEDELSDAGFSQTSFATTAPDSERLIMPSLPQRAHDGPFECPFCFMIISVTTSRQWKKHVLRDLRPYICLVEGCSAANKEYGRRHEWISHMLQKHWKSWACPYRPVTQMELDALIARCGQTQSPSSASPVNCPLCQDALESVQHYQRHVGRHQVELALFALPRTYEDDDELHERDEDQETMSTRSGSYSEATNDNSPAVALATASESRNAELQEGISIDDATDHANLVDEAAKLHERWKSLEERAMKWETSEDNGKGGKFGGRLASGSSSNNNLTGSTFSVYEGSTTGAIGGKGIIPIKAAPLKSSPEPGAVPSPRNLTVANSSEPQCGSSKSADASKSTGDEESVDQPEHVNISIEFLEPQVELPLARRERERAQKKYELEYEQNELEMLELADKIKEEEKRREQLATEQYELEHAKKELEALRRDRELEENLKHHEQALQEVYNLKYELKRREALEFQKLKEELRQTREVLKASHKELEHRIKYKIELGRLKEEEEALAEKSRREKEARDAVEKYKKEEAEKREREYKIETFLESGSIKGKGKKEEDAAFPSPYEEKPRPTYTRMARRHLSLETLRVYDVDYVLDQDPEYVLIKRWVPEHEQDILWKHTRALRELRANEVSTHQRRLEKDV